MVVLLQPAPPIALAHRLPVRMTDAQTDDAEAAVMLGEQEWLAVNSKAFLDEASPCKEQDKPQARFTCPGFKLELPADVLTNELTKELTDSGLKRVSNIGGNHGGTCRLTPAQQERIAANKAAAINNKAAAAARRTDLAAALQVRDAEVASLGAKAAAAVVDDGFWRQAEVAAQLAEDATAAVEQAAAAEKAAAAEEAAAAKAAAEKAAKATVKAAAKEAAAKVAVMKAVAEKVEENAAAAKAEDDLIKAEKKEVAVEALHAAAAKAAEVAAKATAKAATMEVEALAAVAAQVVAAEAAAQAAAAVVAAAAAAAEVQAAAAAEVEAAEVEAAAAEAARLRDDGGEPEDMLTVKRSYMIAFREGLRALGPVGEEMHTELRRDLKRASVFRGSPSIWNHVVRVPYLFSRGVVTA